jgi:hypothetical protein
MPTKEAVTKVDNPWNDIIAPHFEQFMLFFYPEIHKRIDFSREQEILEDDLQTVLKGTETDPLMIDKLIKVWLTNGKMAVFYTHIDTRGKKDKEFAKRLFIRNYRLFDIFGPGLVSLVLLGDDLEDWRPKSYSYGLAGFTMFCRFPMLKLVDYDEEELEKSENPFSIVVRAHIKALETTRSSQKRLSSKKDLFKALYEAKLDKEDTINFYRFLDWVMPLPKGFGQQFYSFVAQYEEKNNIYYITRAKKRAKVEKAAKVTKSRKRLKKKPR